MTHLDGDETPMLSALSTWIGVAKSCHLVALLMLFETRSPGQFIKVGTLYGSRKGPIGIILKKQNSFGPGFPPSSYIT